jgi:ATP/maltotriose-dependent transcriptional regulator MalT
MATALLPSGLIAIEEVGTIRGQVPTFTERQTEVVRLIAAGCSNEEVGARLGISARTAKAHADTLRQKLGVARRRQIPAAYRALTQDDPLAGPLETGIAQK